MSLFKKPVIKVLSVKHETREVEESIMDSKALGYGYCNTTRTTKDCSYTIVLMTKNGELMTREFNGTWDLSDIKAWE